MTSSAPCSLIEHSSIYSESNKHTSFSLLEVEKKCKSGKRSEKVGRSLLSKSCAVDCRHVVFAGCSRPEMSLAKKQALPSISSSEHFARSASVYVKTTSVFLYTWRILTNTHIPKPLCDRHGRATSLNLVSNAFNNSGCFCHDTAFRSLNVSEYKLYLGSSREHDLP